MIEHSSMKLVTCWRDLLLGCGALSTLISRIESTAKKIGKFAEGSWNLFCNSDPNCSWGDNNRTLITGDVIRGVLELLDLPESSEKWTEEQRQVEKVFTRLDLLFTLGDLYIDLEN